jgi:hypothetical protein
VADLPWTPFTRAEIIKPDRDRDFYVAWSHIVEAPTWCGTYAEAFMADCDPDRLDRADLNGSSMHLHDPMSSARPPGCWWDDDGLIAEQLGFLPRAKLAAYVTAYAGDRLGAAFAMLERFEDRSRADHRAMIRRAIYYHLPHHDPDGCGHCKTCHPEQAPRPLAVDGREYRRRQRARQRRRRHAH